MSRIPLCSASLRMDRRTSALNAGSPPVFHLSSLDCGISTSTLPYSLASARVSQARQVSERL